MAWRQNCCALTIWYCTNSKEWYSVVSGFQMIHRVSILPKDLFAQKVYTFAVALLAPNQRCKEMLAVCVGRCVFFSLCFSFASSRMELKKVTQVLTITQRKKKTRMETPSAMERRANEKFLSLTRVSISFVTKDISLVRAYRVRESDTRKYKWHRQRHMERIARKTHKL